tara:strand:+ start:318 stop:722 length:405 start_codon:yes stop_codon:yes gene_type:complete
MKKKHLKVLEDISKNAPKEWLSKLTKMKKTTPTVERVVNLALKSDDVSPEKKAEIQRLKDRGTFSKKAEEVVPKYEKKLDTYYDEEVKRAIKEGRLPHPKEDAFLKKLRKKHNAKVIEKGDVADHAEQDATNKP